MPTWHGVISLIMTSQMQRLGNTRNGHRDRDRHSKMNKVKGKQHDTRTSISSKIMFV